MKSCAYCGRANPDEVAHCSECGTADFVAPEPVPDPEPQAQTSEEDGLTSDVPDDSEAELCTVCLFPNLPDSRWCKRCDAPMSPLVTFMLPDAAYAVGSVFRRAIEAPAKPIVLFGVWAYFLPGLLGNGWLLLLLFWNYDVMTFKDVVAVLIMMSLSASVLYRASRSYLAIRRSRENPRILDNG